MYRINSFNTVSDETLKIASKFISSNSFNNGISFLEQDMNYYEDFEWLYFLYENDSLISVLSVFVPDSASCEIYFHLCDNKIIEAESIFKYIFEYVEIQLTKFDLYNVYILWDCCENIDFNHIFSNTLRYNHSECLMKYDLNHSFSLTDTKLSFNVTDIDNGVCIETFLDENCVGICNIDLSDDYALIYGVEITPSKRGLGFGRETLLITLNFLLEKNYTNILLHVNSANTAAYALYSHHGFNTIQKIDYWKLV